MINSVFKAQLELGARRTKGAASIRHYGARPSRRLICAASEDMVSVPRVKIAEVIKTLKHDAATMKRDASEMKTHAADMMDHAEDMERKAALMELSAARLEQDVFELNSAGYVMDIQASTDAFDAYHLAHGAHHDHDFSSPESGDNRDDYHLQGHATRSSDIY